ncbi:MAG TPA: N-6 DNA methylase [Tepidisphaeraceae bacterium]|jgi:hypothetical protein|nr:N-6 DNA methylase [Tepidisphaeraceae bacterium]
MARPDLLQQLGFERSPHFLRAGDSALETAPAYGHVFRRAKAEPGLLGVYTLRPAKATANTPSIPAIYLCRVASEAQADRAHRLVWNQDVVPFVIVETPRGYRLYSGFDYDRRPDRQAKNLLREFNSASDLAQSGFHADAIDDGMLWRRWGREVRPESRVDWRLLGNLRTLDRWLQKRGLKSEVSHALIGKYVYLYYLRHRKILSERKLEAWGIRERAVFGREATSAGLQAVTDRLDEWLNGGVFPLSFGRPDSPSDDHVAHVAATFAGDEPADGDDWQLHLDFQAYDFSYIPIETLSVVYEQFLHAPLAGERSRGREAGAYYTPIPVVNFMLAEMEDRRPLDRGVKVLDPSCGSGAFLVQCYRRLIEKEYPATGTQPRPVQLRELMQRSIFGVDRDPDACSVTELSLVMTLLDYCDPPDLEDGTRFKLPSLRGENIIEENFFSSDRSCWELLGRRRFDWVVGNPPWKRLNVDNLSADDEPVGAWLRGQGQRGTPVGSNQVAQAFTWEVGRFLAEDGHAGLLLPASTLFDEFSADFRRSFFRKFRVSSVANFSNLAEVLFAGRSRVPAAALFYSKREKPLEVADVEHVSTYSPLVANQEPTRPVVENKRNETWALALNASEIRDVPLAEVLTGSALPWKLASWGSHLDRRLLERVAARYGTFRDLERDGRLVLAEGPQLRPHSGPGRERCEEVVGRQVLDTDALARLRRIFVFPPHALQENTDFYLRLRGGRRGLTVCGPPHVIVSAARNFAVYTADYLIVPPRQVGITSPGDDELLLKAVALYLNSDFAVYQQFLTSSELGVKRPRASLDSLRGMPTPIAELSRTALEGWAALHDRLARASARQMARDAGGDPTLFDTAVMAQQQQQPPEDLERLLEELNRLVGDVLGFRTRERALVEDLVQIRLQLDDGKLGRPAVEPPTSVHLKRYAKRLKAELDGFIGDELPKRYDVDIIFDAHTGMIQLTLVKADQPNEIRLYAADDDTAAELQKTRQRLRRKHAQWVYFDRNLQIFEGRHTLLFKPMQRFHWTESQAMFDAAEVISRTLAYQGAGR